MRSAPRSTVARRIGVAVCLLIGLAGVLELAGGGGHGGGRAHGAVRPIDGVPVGVLHSRSGALAAAANYVALGSQTLEQAPARFAALVKVAYLPSVRARVLSEAVQLRATDVRDMRNYAQGGHGIALIAAQRLTRYTGGSASVLSLLGGVVWGPRLAPRQTWNLVETTLAWRHGRWHIASSVTSAAPAPAPAIVYVRDGNDHAGAFGVLAGMSSPVYGAVEG